MPRNLALSMLVQEKGKAPMRTSVRSLVETMDFDHLIEQFNKIFTIWMSLAVYFKDKIHWLEQVNLEFMLGATWQRESVSSPHEGKGSGDTSSRDNN